MATTVQHGKDPRFAMYVGSITMHPIDPSLPGGVNHPINQRRSQHDLPRHRRGQRDGRNVLRHRHLPSTDAGATWDLLSGTVTQAVTVKGLDGTFNLRSTAKPPSTCRSTPLPRPSERPQRPRTIGGVGGSVTVTQTPVAEVQRFTVIGTAGTFTLTFNGQTTAALAFNATAAQVQDGPRGTHHDRRGQRLVALTGTTYTVTFAGTLGIYDRTTMTGLGAAGRPSSAPLKSSGAG